MPESLALLALALMLVAFLYSTVGHGGASGYIAVMTLFGLGVEIIRPTALALNILVALIGSIQWWRAGHFSWALFWPFAVLAVPCAFLGGWLRIPADFLKILLGLVLLYSAARLLFRKSDPGSTRPPRLSVALASGAGIGFLSGLTGTGGGIFLTPLLIFMKWAKAREAAATSSLFILVNSIAGLGGQLGSGSGLPDLTWMLAAAVAAGGYAGSRLGSRHTPIRGISFLLAIVLLIASGKLLLG
jgi:uncharacterized membrane protein YfcA